MFIVGISITFWLYQLKRKFLFHPFSCFPFYFHKIFKFCQKRSQFFLKLNIFPFLQRTFLKLSVLLT